MEMILCFLFGLAIGSILTAPARRKRFETDIQEEIEIEALKREAEGLNRKGDDVTEIEPFMEGVGCDITKRFNLRENRNSTPAQLKIAMTKQTLPQYVIDNLSLCIPPSEDYTGIVITDKGNFTFINGRPSQPFGQWGCYVYSTYYAEEEVENAPAEL